MYYDCISADIGWFLESGNDSGNPRSSVANGNDLFAGIASCRDHFCFALVDLGPSEVFGDYQMLRELVRRIRRANFVPRLLTGGLHFDDAAQVQRQFVELVQLGVHRITLRVDGATAESLPDSNLLAYINACSVSGLTCELRLDIDDPVPDSLFDLATRMERLFFYTSIFPKLRRKVERTTLRSGQPIEGLGQQRMRIVVSGNGDVMLREYRETIREICLGNVREMPLPALIDPKRLNLVGGTRSNGVQI